MSEDKSGSRAGAVASELALVEEGDGEQGRAEDEEGEDAVGAVEEGEVVEKDFKDDDAEKNEGLPTQNRRLTLDAEEKQKAGIDGPENGERKMLGEGVINRARSAAEVIPELLAEGNKSEKIDGDGKEGSFGLWRI